MTTTTHDVSCPHCATRNRVPVVAAGKARCGRCKRDLPLVVDVDTATFDQVIATSTLPVLVDFWAEWCGPCRMVGPAIEQVAGERAGALRVLKVDVDAQPAVSRRFGVQGIPTMILFRDGVEVARQVGAQPAARIGAWLDGAVGAVP
ncbi:MAG: thioredoxin [Acidimicrobiales bacterium]